MNKDYACEGIESPHVQVEVRRVPTGDSSSMMGGIAGGREWYRETRVLVDGEPVGDWVSHDLLSSDPERYERLVEEDALTDRSAREELVEDADHPAVSEEAVSAAFERASQIREVEHEERCEEDDRDWDFSCPWWGSSGYGGASRGPWRLG